MSSYSPTLKTMVKRTVAQARASNPDSVDPAVRERRIYRALGELSQARPRIVEFAPQIALTRALHRDHAHSVDRPEWAAFRPISHDIPM